MHRPEGDLELGQYTSWEPMAVEPVTTEHVDLDRAGATGFDLTRFDALREVGQDAGECPRYLTEAAQLGQVPAGGPSSDWIEETDLVNWRGSLATNAPAVSQSVCGTGTWSAGRASAPDRTDRRSGSSPPCLPRRSG